MSAVVSRGRVASSAARLAALRQEAAVVRVERVEQPVADAGEAGWRLRGWRLEG